MGDSKHSKTSARETSDSLMVDLGDIGKQRLEEFSENPEKLIVPKVEDYRSFDKIQAAFKIWKADTRLYEDASKLKMLGQTILVDIFHYIPPSNIMDIAGSMNASISLLPYVKTLAVSKLASEKFGIERHKIYLISKSMLTGFHQPYDHAQGLPNASHKANSYIYLIDRPEHHVVLKYGTTDMDYMFTRVLDPQQFIAEYEGDI